VEKENAELDEKHNQIVKKCDDYITKIASMEEEIDLLQKQIHDKEKECHEVGVKPVFFSTKRICLREAKNKFRQCRQNFPGVHGRVSPPPPPPQPLYSPYYTCAFILSTRPNLYAGLTVLMACGYVSGYPICTPTENPFMMYS
jgi:hypothetical protein